MSTHLPLTLVSVLMLLGSIFLVAHDKSLPSLIGSVKLGIAQLVVTQVVSFIALPRFVSHLTDLGQTHHETLRLWTMRESNPRPNMFQLNSYTAIVIRGSFRHTPPVHLGWTTFYCTLDI